MLKKLFKISIFLLFFLLSTIIFLDWYTTHNIQAHKLSQLKKKAWSHAGYFQDKAYQANSMQSFTNAKKNNAEGLELDVIYDKELRKYIVSHDYPYKSYNGKLLFLDSVFATYGNNFKYWLDFKNLKDMNEEEVITSQLLLKKMLSTENICIENILVESTNLDNLSHFTKSGYYTSWWILPYKSRYRSIARNYKYKFYYLLGKYSSLSMPYNYYSRIEKSMNNIPVNLWTINERNIFLRNMKKPQVKIILTDQNWFEY